MSYDPESLRGRRALVTGARGFIGRHLTRRLLELGAEVHGTSRIEISDEDAIRWHRVDLTDVAPIDALLATVEPDVIFHLAGFVSGSRELDAVIPALRENLVATVHLLTSVQRSGRGLLIHAGSMEEPAAGSWPPVPGSPYAAAKFAASTYARFFHALYGTRVVVARIFMVYGPDQPDESKLVPYVIRALLAGKVPELSSGARQVDWIHVDDAVEGLIALATTPGLEGTTLDVGSGALASVATVAQTVAKLAGSTALPALGRRPDRALEVEPVADLATTTERTGWTPRLELREGLEQTLAWYRQQLSAG
jgi:UDP-glucose 4-epimerase